MLLISTLTCPFVPTRATKECGDIENPPQLPYCNEGGRVRSFAHLPLISDHEYKNELRISETA